MTANRRDIVDPLRSKVLETIDRTGHLVSLVPPDKLAWRPESPHSTSPPVDLGHLLGHLLDCLAGFCAALYAAFPRELADLVDLRSVAVNQSGPPNEATKKIKIYTDHIDRGFQLCTDEDLCRKIPTVFVPEGELLLTILLGNLEHLINHKYQLFFYLKLAGLQVTTSDLYTLRGAPENRALGNG